jgi:hypothetical protein
MSDLLVLRVGLDTLEVTFDGEVLESHLSELERLKLIAQDAETPQPYVLGDVEFMVRAKGLGAYGLSTRPRKELWDEVLVTLGLLGNLEEHGVSRADVYVDSQGWTPTLQEMSKNVACRARKNPIYPNLEHPETFYFGMGGQRVVRVYNKTTEVAHSGKAWLFTLYGEVLGFDRNVDVWRIEFQIRRDALRELSLRSSSEAFAGIAALLDWGMREFAQLRVPTGDDKIARWPEDPRWTQLRTARVVETPLVRARHIASLMPLGDVMKRFLGALAVAGAHLGETEYMNVLQRLSYMAEAHMMTEKIEFADMVETRRRRLVLTRDERQQPSEPF